VNSTYTALIQRDGDWWIGWVKEIAGVNSQGRTREELVENLRSALGEALQMNREDAEAAASGEYEEMGLSV
jgi:predicted RNase H-like HicB family nuclease